MCNIVHVYFYELLDYILLQILPPGEHIVHIVSSMFKFAEQKYYHNFCVIHIKNPFSNITTIDNTNDMGMSGK